MGADRLAENLSALLCLSDKQNSGPIRQIDGVVYSRLMLASVLFLFFVYVHIIQGIGDGLNTFCSMKVMIEAVFNLHSAVRSNRG